MSMIATVGLWVALAMVAQISASATRFLLPENSNPTQRVVVFVMVPLALWGMASIVYTLFG